ncbi:hypothetical protein A3K92_08740 [Thermococcus gorgonarius]|uniref:Uncharacterized protein n=2 Tax=Thermococcus gorgonarius TaxID=71997 RepID=A0A2Z2M898_THEGO|nr:hypothetical protein A3K92_08740 [Thermococcus gorgonarius]
MYSLLPLAFLLIALLPFGVEGVIIAMLAALGVFWYLPGMLNLVLVGVFLIHKNVDPLYSLIVFSLAFLVPITGKLDRERAPLGDYLTVSSIVLLSVPTYFLIKAISALLGGFDVTILATVLLAVVYFFAKSIST